MVFLRRAEGMAACCRRRKGHARCCQRSLRSCMASLTAGRCCCAGQRAWLAVGHSGEASGAGLTWCQQLSMRACRAALGPSCSRTAEAVAGRLGRKADPAVSCSSTSCMACPAPASRLPYHTAADSVSSCDVSTTQESHTPQPCPPLSTARKLGCVLDQATSKRTSTPQRLTSPQPCHQAQHAHKTGQTHLWVLVLICILPVDHLIQ